VVVKTQSLNLLSTRLHSGVQAKLCHFHLLQCFRKMISLLDHVFDLSNPTSSAMRLRIERLGGPRIERLGVCSLFVLSATLGRRRE
jgi:hypothetical protein